MEKLPTMNDAGQSLSANVGEPVFGMSFGEDGEVPPWATVLVTFRGITIRFEVWPGGSVNPPPGVWFEGDVLREVRHFVHRAVLKHLQEAFLAHEEVAG